MHVDNVGGRVECGVHVGERGHGEQERASDDGCVDWISIGGDDVHGVGTVCRAASSNGPGGISSSRAGIAKVVEVSGSGLGQIGMSSRAVVGASSCAASRWLSESSVMCSVAVGTGGSGHVVVTAGTGGAGVGSFSGGWSHD